MPDTNALPHPAFSVNSQRNSMTLSSALLIISENENAICRRQKWGNSIKHVYVEINATEGQKLILVTDSGLLSYYIPSIDDLKAVDWLAG